MAVGYNPRAVTDGLVLALDAGNAKSYPGSGTTWSDLSGNSNNGTLTNGPTFSSADGGYFTFDGTNDYVQFTSTSVQTICFWGRMDADIPNLAGLVCKTATGDGSLRARSVSFGKSSVDINDFQRQYTSSFMINGVSDLSGSAQFTIPNGRTLQQDFYVGAIGNANNLSTISHTFMGRVYKGRVYAVYLYNRQLTNDELLQNYNALKGRFGL
tara:strand:+ start:909 stop:1544 length:636 start_codon:yes stop_codon:yes gene_type:complete